MSKGPQFIQFFGSDPLKRLHGCALAEVDRGANSPCARLAHPLRRPQIGLGNPKGPVLFISPSPLDPASACNEAFTEWLEREASLEHHMTAATPQPYFRFVRAVFLSLRERWGEKPVRRDAMELAFHTSAVRCATEHPDRVTDAALDQCAARHLDALVQSVDPRVIVALGGPPARFFFTRQNESWSGWTSIENLHGSRLEYSASGRSIPVILSMHPFQRHRDLHPEVLGRALADLLQSQDLAPGILRAA